MDRFQKRGRELVTAFNELGQVSDDALGELMADALREEHDTTRLKDMEAQDKTRAFFRHAKDLAADEKLLDGVPRLPEYEQACNAQVVSMFVGLASAMALRLGISRDEFVGFFSRALVESTE